MSTPPRRLRNNRESQSGSNRQVQISSSNRRRTRKDCQYCDKNHPLRKCFQFRRLSVTERKRIVRKFNYCVNCLAHSHILKDCRSRERCKICYAEHHTLLHTTHKVRRQNTNRQIQRRQQHQSPQQHSRSNIRIPASNGSASHAPTIIINVNTGH